ncbi:TrmB family transcriptional regulator [Thermococcus sp. JCM 11816]|uniref:TrmB family transcriptional regulator n=1 Tax=Thermococcus sp. (strain JCM 11816 / KS-1) TaxID=1295125 RepID=UPI003465591F
MLDEKLVENLKRLGLKDYEARVYAALVLLGPSKASEVARESGVPRPKVYEVLKELHRKGFVDFSEGGKPAFFRAVEPEKVIGGALRDEYIKSAEEAIISLKSGGGKREEEWYPPVWYLQGGVEHPREGRGTHRRGGTEGGHGGLC